MKTIQTNTKPIDSQPMQVDIKRLADMGLMSVDTKITQDLFKVTDCPDCNGTGDIDTDQEEEDNCESCNGTGIL